MASQLSQSEQASRFVSSDLFVYVDTGFPNLYHFCLTMVPQADIARNTVKATNSMQYFDFDITMSNVFQLAPDTSHHFFGAMIPPF